MMLNTVEKAVSKTIQTENELPTTTLRHLRHSNLWGCREGGRPENAWKVAAGRGA